MLLAFHIITLSGKQNTTLSVKGISHEMTVEVIVANYEWNIQKFSGLQPINIDVSYSSSAEKGHNSGEACFNG